MSAAFLATVHAATFVARTTVAGQLVVGTAQYAVSGTDDVSGASVHATITIATPGGQPDETIVVDHRVYHRTGTSPWFRAATSGATDLGALLRALLLVTDMGVESHHDRLLHHLVLPAGTSLAPALLGVAGVGRTGLVAGVEFWATDEGAIAAMVVTATWKQTSGGALVDGSTTVEYTFADPATAVAIPAPTDIWTTYKSKVSHMTFSYPVDLTVVTGSKLYPVDGVVATSVRTLSVEIGRFPSDGLTIDQVVHRFLSDPYNKTGFHLDSETKVEMAGVSGRQVLIHMTQAHELHVDTPAYRAKKRHWIYTEIVKGAWVYEVFIASDAGYEAEDLTLLHDIVASVVIT